MPPLFDVPTSRGLVFISVYRVPPEATPRPLGPIVTGLPRRPGHLAGDGDRAKAMSLLYGTLAMPGDLGMRPLTELVLSPQELLGA